MLALMLCTQWRPEWLVSGFTDDPAVVEVASHFLRIASFNFVASGLIFTCSGHLPGPRPHLAGTGRDRVAHRHLHAAGDLALDDAGLPDRPGLVRVGRQRVGAGGDQLRPAAVDDAGTAPGYLNHAAVGKAGEPEDKPYCVQVIVAVSALITSVCGLRRP